MAESTKTAKLDFGGKSVTLPVHSGTIGPDVIDIGALYKETKAFTFDPGFTSTASCESKITYIDGDEGVLLYRGYPIEQLAEEGDFIETCYLLLYGELPTPAQRKKFENNITYHTMVHEQMALLANARSATGRIFTRAENGHAHCQIGNLPLAIDVMLKWVQAH